MNQRKMKMCVCMCVLCVITFYHAGHGELLKWRFLYGWIWSENRNNLSWTNTASNSLYAHYELHQPWTLHNLFSRDTSIKVLPTQATCVSTSKLTDYWLVLLSACLQLKLLFSHSLWMLASVWAWVAPWHDICADKQPNYRQARSEVDPSVKKFRDENPPWVCVCQHPQQ